MSTEIETTSIADLDFTPALPCEHTQHAEAHGGYGQGPAAWDYRSTCPKCGGRAHRLVCDPFRARTLAEGLTCSSCRSHHENYTFTPIPEVTP